MGAILGSVIKNLLEVLAFVVIAWAGIDKKKKAAVSKKAKADSDTK